MHLIYLHKSSRLHFLYSTSYHTTVQRRNDKPQITPVHTNYFRVNLCNPWQNKQCHLQARPIKKAAITPLRFHQTSVMFKPSCYELFKLQSLLINCQQKYVGGDLQGKFNEWTVFFLSEWQEISPGS